MNIVGQLTQTESGYKGVIKSRTYRGNVSLKPIFPKLSEKAPDFEVWDETGFQTGSAWTKKGDKGTFLSLTLDNDGMEKALNLAAFATKADARVLDVVWSRPKVQPVESDAAGAAA